MVFALFVGYRFGEIMCIKDSYVYQNGVLCFLIHESYVRSVKQYCFVRKYAAVPIQLEIVILQYTGWCVLVGMGLLLLLLLLLLFILLLSSSSSLLSSSSLSLSSRFSKKSYRT